MEVVTESGSDQPEVFFGRYDSGDNTVSGGISIPGLNSILAGFSRDTEVQGLDSVDRGDRPSNVTLVHWAFDIMVGIGTLLLGLVAEETTGPGPAGSVEATAGESSRQ
jgi:cytochrome d ubiquinol oxidase subunit I